jgi:hypothetical protein
MARIRLVDMAHGSRRRNVQASRRRFEIADEVPPRFTKRICLTEVPRHCKGVTPKGADDKFILWLGAPGGQRAPEVSALINRKRQINGNGIGILRRRPIPEGPLAGLCDQVAQRGQCQKLAWRKQIAMPDHA